MNWVDFTVIGIVVGYSLIGYARGFIYSVFKVASFFVAAFMAMQFHPYISKVLISAIHLDVTMKDMIARNVGKVIDSGQIEQGIGANAINGLVNSWGLPKPVEEMVYKNVSIQANQLAGGLVNSLSESLAIVAVNIISIMIIFAVISFVLIFVRNLSEGIAKLPIFKQVNRAGGIVFGALQGIIIIYIAFAVLTLFASSQELKNIFVDINSSVIAKVFYTNNLLLIWALGGKR